MIGTLEAPRPLRRTARLIPPAATPYWPPGALAVAALAPRHCRWPLGEVHDVDFQFCGATRQRGAYCAAHALLAYVGGAK